MWRNSSRNRSSRPVNPYASKRRSLPETCLCRDLDRESLDALVAPEGSPIRLGASNPWPDRVALTELGDHSYLHDATSPFASALLRFGGTGAITLRIDPREIRRLGTTGQLWTGEGCRTSGGRQSNCHGNSGLYWAANMDRVVLASGVALSEDGLWRSHSWCVVPGERPTIVETTTPRLLYFGEAIDAETARIFCHDNAEYGLPDLLPAPVRDAAPSPG